MDGFNTISWRLAQTIGKVYDPDKVDSLEHWEEDCQVGEWTDTADEKAEFVTMDPNETFDVLEGIEGDKENYLAKEWNGTREIRGPVKDVRKAVFLHRLKKDAMWFAFQNYFDGDGWTGERRSRNETVDRSNT
ncbi:hypothetical protein ACLMJK_004142 [Lecanora helva]